ncbi:alcohol oxidase [Mycena haematopus]|nr:alcohol oxidase [Mycena haematopus]
MWPFNRKYPVLPVDKAGTPLETVRKPDTQIATYDYIIVGGGTAGCCLASRLSEDPSVSVLVLERGSVHDAWFSRIPLISSDLTTSGKGATPIVRSPSAPIKAAEGQVVDIVHAQTLGGGSAVNAMLVTRGAVGDFDYWAELGHPSWDYLSLKPYFIKSEKSLSHWQNSDDRGNSGPWVNQTFPDLPFKVQKKVKDAALALGLADVSNFNSPQSPVDLCATLDVAIDKNMRRMSSYHAFLPAAVAHERRARLKVCTNAVATRVDFDAARVAVGVVFESSGESGRRMFYARATKEIVICCGALGSPQLLLLSGIGPEEDLKDHGIETVVDLPGVGKHLQDHVGVPLMYEVPLEDTLHHSENRTWKGVLEFGKYVFAGTGIMAGPVTPISIFAHSTHLDDETAVVVKPISSAAAGTMANRPDIEIMPIAHWCADPPPYQIRTGVFSFLLCVVQPKSLGSVRLASRDPHVRPIVDLGFLSNQEDFIPLRKGIKLCLRLAEEVARQGYLMKALQVPSSEKQDDVDKFIRGAIRTCYHYASSCRMAPREQSGVVNDELEVYGVRGLRVCDASIFPNITSGHTMAPVIAVAERCADLMKGIS